MDCQHHEAIQLTCNANTEGLTNLAKATNGKLDRVHARIDKLMLLVIGCLISGIGTLIMGLASILIGHGTK